jgi:phosphate-selective porin OprO and OprP
VLSASRTIASFAAVLALGVAPASAGAVGFEDPTLQSEAQTNKNEKPKKQKKGKTEKAAKKKDPKEATTDPAAQDPNEPAPDEGRFASDTDAEPSPPLAEQVETGNHGLRVSWKQHPSFRVGSVFRIDLEAKFQEDIHSSYIGEPELERAELHRNRLGVQGHLFKRIEYEVERELTEKELDAGETPKSPWKDVYVNLAFIKNAQVKIGKFKIPFGLDQLTGVTHNDFVYRSLGAIYLSPARDVGVMAHGSFLKHGLQYWSGVFKHDGDNARSSKIRGGDQTFAARVTGTPFRPVMQGLGEVEIGTAFTVSRLSDDSFRPNGLRGRTIMTQHVFYEPVYVKGARQRWETDVDWTAGPASARAEFTWVSDDRKQQGIGDNDLPDARARSWYVSGSWILTGERKTRPIKAGGEFLQGGWGAVELAARIEGITFDSAGGTDEPFRNPRAETIFPETDRALTLGVNWTLNRFVKLQFNGIREHVDDAERNPVVNGAAFWSRVIRLQFVL